MNLNLIQGLILLSLLGSCGQPATVQTAGVRKSTFVVKLGEAADASGTSSNNMPLKSVGVEPEVLSAGRFFLTTDLEGISGLNPEVIITLDTPSQKNVAVGKKKGMKIDWDINLPHGDGEYTIKVNVANAERVGLKNFKSWSKKIRLDSNGPTIKMTKNYKESADGSDRFISVSATIEGEIHPVKCELRVCSAIGKSKDNLLALPMLADVNNGNSFSLKDIKLPLDLDNYFFAKVACVDDVGNEREIGEELSSRSTDLGFKADVVGEKKALYESADDANAATYVFARTGSAPDKISTSFKFTALLLDKKTSGDASPALIEREKGMLRVYVTDYEVTSVADLEVTATKTPYLGVGYAAQLDAVIPAKLLGKTKLYISLTQLREAVEIMGTAIPGTAIPGTAVPGTAVPGTAIPGTAIPGTAVPGLSGSNGWKEVLIGSSPITIYVQKEGDGLEFLWKSGPQYLAPDATASLKVPVLIAPKSRKGAPLGPWPEVQYTTNNKDFVKISDDKLTWSPVQGQKDVFSAEFKYPLVGEKPFRIRLLGANAAGVLATSSLSANLVGIALPKWEGVAATGQVAIGASVLCKINDRFYVPLFIKRGDAAIATAAGVCGTSQLCMQISNVATGTLERLGADSLSLLTKKGDQATVFYGAFDTLGSILDAQKGLKSLKLKIPSLANTVLDFSTVAFNTTDAPFNCDDQNKP